MKLKGMIFSLCFLVAGAAMADTPDENTTPAVTQPVVHHRKRHRRAHAKASVTAAVTPALVATPAPDVAAAKPPVSKSDAFQAWLIGIKKHLSESDTRSNKLVAVAAVRGDETSDASPLYWKGKKPEVRNDVPERKDFEAAIDIALKGDNVGAKERLQSFLIAYPKSSLAPDAKETLARLENN